MALPTLEKTWQFNVNQAYGGIGVDADNQDLLFKIKQSLIGFGSGDWTVVSSSDGTTADLTDNWTAYTDLVFNTGAHAWIVLANSSTGAELCIDCNVAFSSSQNASIRFSPGGGYATTGLVTTSRPTPPADEITFTTWGGSNAAITGKLHAMMSNDGECTRVVVASNNWTKAFWLFDAVKNPTAGWTNPNVVMIHGNSTTGIADYTTYGEMYSTPRARGFITAVFSLYFSSEAYQGGVLGQATAGTSLDSQLNAYPMVPIGLVSTAAGHIGRKGALYDIWWGSTVPNTGDTYPADLTYQFAHFGDIILPWAGVALQVS